jgi:hypothetical protein
MKTKLLIAALALILVSACQKKTDCTASVTVNDENGLPVQGADVRLFANVKDQQNGTVTADLKANGITDETGRVFFTFKLPAIYDVKVIAKYDTLHGIIRLEEGQTVTKTLAIK